MLDLQQELILQYDRVKKVLIVYLDATIAANGDGYRDLMMDIVTDILMEAEDMMQVNVLQLSSTRYQMHAEDMQNLVTELSFYK